MEAVALGNGSMVKILLNKDADVNIANHKSLTAMHIIGYLDTCECVCECSAGAAWLVSYFAYFWH